MVLVPVTQESTEDIDPIRRLHVLLGEVDLPLTIRDSEPGNDVFFGRLEGFDVTEPIDAIGLNHTGERMLYRHREAFELDHAVQTELGLREAIHGIDGGSILATARWAVEKNYLLQTN